MRGVGRFGPLRERPFRLLWLARTGSCGRRLARSRSRSRAPSSQDLDGGATPRRRHRPRLLTVGGAAVTLAGGVWADRLPRRAVMISADLVRLGTQSVTAVLLFDGAAHVWQLAVLQLTRRRGGRLLQPGLDGAHPAGRQRGHAAAGERADLALPQRDARSSAPPSRASIVAVAGAGVVLRDRRSELPRSASIFVAAMSVAPYARPARAAASGATSRTAGARCAATAGSRPVSSASPRATSGSASTSCWARSWPSTSSAGSWGWGWSSARLALGGVLGGFIAYRIRPSAPGGDGVRDLDAVRRCCRSRSYRRCRSCS